MGALVKALDEYPSMESTDALDDYGYVLEVSGSGTVQKCLADNEPDFIAEQDTVDPITETAVANKQVACLPLAGMVAEVQYNVASTDAAIAVGDKVAVKGANAAGTVKKFVATSHPATYSATTSDTAVDELKTVVGVALEAVSSPGTGNNTGKIKVLLTGGL